MRQLGKIVTVLLFGLIFKVTGELSKVMEKCLKPYAMCATLPANCLNNTSNCIAAASISQVENDSLQIHYAAINGYKYMSLGFSRDEKMGEEAVVDCILDEVGKVNIYSAYNVGHKHYLEETKNSAIKLIESGIADGIYCNFEINGQFKVKEYTGIGRGESTYIILALGQTEDGKPKYHEVTAVSVKIFNSSTVKKVPITVFVFLVSFSTYLYPAKIKAK